MGSNPTKRASIMYINIPTERGSLIKEFKTIQELMNYIDSLSSKTANVRVEGMIIYVTPIV